MANKGEQFPEQSQLQAGKHKVIGETYPSKPGGDVLFQAMNNQGVQGNQKGTTSCPLAHPQTPKGPARKVDAAQTFLSAGHRVAAPFAK